MIEPQLGALLLADGRLPTGGHAHSGGLEPALADGLAPDRIPEYLRARLLSVTRTEAAAAVLTARAGRSPPVRVEAIQDGLCARTPNEPVRAASGLLGQGLARLARRLWPEHPAVMAMAELGARPQRPVALGVIAAALELTDEQVARACLYEDAQTVASAALKLAPVDPTDTARWVLDAADAIEDSVAAAVRVTSPSELPARSAPLAEQWALEHTQRTRRIFVA